MQVYMFLGPVNVILLYVKKKKIFFLNFWKGLDF